MSLTRFARDNAPCALLVTLLACSLASVPACSVFEPKGPSSVAQGKYYASGNPQYDQFFITLFDLQVALADAPGVPDRERAALAQAVGLSAQSPSTAVAEHLREEAQKLLRSGVRIRLEESPVPDSPQQSAVSVHTTSPLPAGESRDLLSKVETSAMNLLRVVTQMNKDQEILRKLEQDSLSLEANVDTTFAQKGLFKRDEVHKNLADAQRVITLIKARSEDVRSQGARLLSTVEQALTTDDSAGRPPPPPPPPEDDSHKPKEPPRRAGPGVASPHARSGAGAPGQAPGAPPPPKAPPASKDFEP